MLGSLRFQTSNLGFQMTRLLNSVVKVGRQFQICSQESPKRPRAIGAFRFRGILVKRFVLDATAPLVYFGFPPRRASMW